jgi:hypothetical protein
MTLLERHGPLRKVVSYHQNEYGADREVLECGHEIGRKEDAYGYTTASRRRCWKCRDEQQRLEEEPR